MNTQTPIDHAWHWAHEVAVDGADLMTGYAARSRRAWWLVKLPLFLGWTALVSALWMLCFAAGAFANFIDGE